MEKNHRIKMGIYKNFPKIDKIPTALHEEGKKDNLESTKIKLKCQKNTCLRTYILDLRTNLENPIQRPKRIVHKTYHNRFKEEVKKKSNGKWRRKEKKNNLPLGKTAGGEN